MSFIFTPLAVRDFRVMFKKLMNELVDNWNTDHPQLERVWIVDGPEKDKTITSKGEFMRSAVGALDLGWAAGTITEDKVSLRLTLAGYYEYQIMNRTLLESSMLGPGSGSDVMS